MFANSTQRRYWMFDSLEELEKLRAESNKSAGKSMVKAGKLGSDSLQSPKEELQLVRSYLINLKDFCRKFTPQMRKSVIATAFIYMKRFYLKESCMEYHPRNIAITCAYLACKVDEFNVSIDQFLKNVKGDCKKAQKTILSNELLLMKKLKFHLTVHLPYRPVEGFLIDIRARYPSARDRIHLLNSELDDFLDKSLFTDACFLFTPPQIALAAICYSAEKCNIDLNAYLSDILFADEPEALDYFKTASIVIKRLIDKDQEEQASSASASASASGNRTTSANQNTHSRFLAAPSK